MSTTNIATQIERLQRDKTAICNAIIEKDESIEISNNISYDDIAAKIALIDTCQCGGGGGDEPVNPLTPSGSDKIEYIDVDGTVLASFDVGDTISADDVPTFPTHTGLTPVEDENHIPLWSKTLAEVNALDHPENIYPRYTVDGDKLVIKVEILDGGADIELNEIYVPSTIRTGSTTISGNSAVEYNDGETEGIESYDWSAQISAYVAGNRDITVNWDDGSSAITHTFNANSYSGGVYSDWSSINTPNYYNGHSDSVYESESDVDDELQDAVDEWEENWQDSFDIEAFISDAVKISTGGSNGNDGWYKHHYNNAGSYTITIVCNQDQNPPQIGTEAGTNNPIYWDDSKYCGLFVKGPESNRVPGSAANDISSALKAQYQGTGENNGPAKAIITNASVPYVKAIYLPKTFKFNWYFFDYNNDTDFYHYAFPTNENDGYVVVDDNWNCAPLYGLDSDPSPSVGTREEPAKYYLFAKSNIYGINLNNPTEDDPNEANSYIRLPKFRMGLANAFKNSKLKAIYNAKPVWANEPYMFAETNIKSIGPIKNVFYFKGVGQYGNEYDEYDEQNSLIPVAPILGYNEKIADYAFYNARNLKNIVLSGDSFNYDDASSSTRNNANYKTGITSIGQYAFAFTNSTTINRKIYIPTVIRETIKQVAEMGVGIHNEPAYTQVTIAGNAFNNNDGLEIYINDTATATKTASDTWYGTEYANTSVTVPLVTLTSALTATNVKLYVPPAKRNAYLQDSNWSRLGSDNIIAYDFANNQIAQE